MTVKSTDSALRRNPSIQKPLQPVQSKYHQIFRDQEALGNVRGYRPEQRIQANARYAKELKREVSHRFSYSSFFVRGDQKDDARFKDIFKRFFASSRGGDPWVEKASKVLAGKFRGYSDIRSVYEVELSEPIRYSGNGEYGSGGYTVTHTTAIGPSPAFIQELKSLIKECYGLKKTFLEILQANRLRLGDRVKLDHRDVSFATYLEKPKYPTLQEIVANNAIPRNQRQPLPRPQMVFFPKYYFLKALSTIYPKCTDKLNEIFTLLLEIKWLEHDNNQIKVYLGQGKNIPKGIGYSDIKDFIDVRGEVYAVKTTRGDGACGLHALLGEPVYGEYVYQGQKNVREVFVERLEEKISNQDIRLMLKNILKAHISATEDPSSRMIFEGEEGLALREGYEWARNQYDSHFLRVKQEEAFFWKDQLYFPPIRTKLLEEARNSSRYRHKSDRQILEMLRETPSLISILIDADRASFLQRLEPCYRGHIFRIIYEKQDLLQSGERAEDLFVLNYMYPHYIQAVKYSGFLFNTQELELAALLFEKKMQVFTTDSGVLTKATDPINEHLEGPPTIIHHAKLHFERCVPSTLEEQSEMEVALIEWNAANALAGLQKDKDKFFRKRFETLIKDEICTLAWSAAISAGTQNPAWFLGQSGRTAIKLWGTRIDPEQQRKDLQMLMLLANSSVAKGLGGNPSQLLMGLGIDLWDIGVRPENINKNEASFRNMGISLVKGVLTLEYKKFAEGILGGALSEGTNRLLETDEKTSAGARILLGLLKNQDAQGIMVGKTVDYAFKKPDPKTEISHKDTGIEVEVDPDSESQFPPQILPEIDETTGEERPVIIEIDDADPIQTPILPPEPVVNVEVANHIEITTGELTKEKDILIQKQAGVDNAQRKVDEKLAKWQKVINDPKSTDKEIKKAFKSLSEAQGNLRNFTTERDDQQTLKVSPLDRELAGLNDRIYEPTEHSSGQVDPILDSSNMNSQPGIPTIQIVAKPSPLSVSMEVKKVHTRKADKEYLIYIHNSEYPGEKKQIGVFPSKEMAHSHLNRYNDYISRIDKLNQDVAQTKSHYLNQGVDADTIDRLKFFKPIFVAISACGKKSNVYEGDQQVCSFVSCPEEYSDHRNEALTEANKLLDQDITSHEQELHEFKKFNAEMIFSIPYSPNVKQAEAERIIREQHQHSESLNEATAKDGEIKRAIPKAQEKVRKRNKETGNFSSVKKFRLEKDAESELKQLRLDESFNRERSERIQKRFEDNNFLLQIAQGNTTREEVAGIKKACHDGDAQTKIAQEKLESRIENFQKTKKDDDYRRVKNATHGLNQANQKNEGVYNRYYELQGVDYKVEPTPELTPPKKASGLEKTKAWINENVSVSVNVQITRDLYKTPPPNSTPSRTDAYGPSEPLQSASVNAPVQEPSIVQNWGWQGVEAMQQANVLKTLENNINTNRQTFSGLPQAQIDYQSISSPGMASTAQFPPTDFSGLGLNNPPPSNALTLGSNRPIQMAGFAPLTGSQASAKLLQGVVSLFLPDMSDMPGAENPMDHINRIITAESVNNFVKSAPKGPLDLLVAGACLMLPDMTGMPGAEDPRTHLKMVTKNAFLKYDDIMQIDPNAFSSRAGKLFGETVALGSAGKVIKVADGLSIFGIACEGGMAGLVMAESHDTNKVAGVAFGFAGGAVFGAAFSRTKPEMKALIDRIRSKPQGLGQQVRAIEALQQPALRSGVFSEGTVSRLSGREIKAIKPMELPYLKKGADWDWFAKNSPRIDELKRVALEKDFYATLSKEFRKIEINELNVRRTLKYAGFKTYSAPQGITTDCSVELSKLSGGMIYRKVGTTTNQNMLVRVMPGKRNQNLVTALSKRERPEWSLRQETPYVVQRRGGDYLTRDGIWISKDDPALTHIPLEIYQFKGWGK